VFEPEAARQAHAAHVEEGASYHRTFESADGRVPFEVHSDPFQMGLKTPGEAGRWSRARSIPGLEAGLMLGPADQLVQLSVHAHKHGFSRLIWLKDIDLLLRAEGDRIDWDVVFASAREEGVSSSIWYTLRLAQQLLGTPVAAAPLAQLAPSAPVRTLYELSWPLRRIANLEGFDRLRAVQFHAAEHWRGMLPSLIFMGRRRDRARAIAHALWHR
jgi:hypothetical protein